MRNCFARRLNRLALAAVIGIGAAATLARAADAPKPEKKAPAPTTNLPKTGSPAELPKPGPDGYIQLFNGKDLAGWEGVEGYWSVKDGMIFGSEKKEASKHTFLVYTGSKFSDFEMHWSYKFATPTGNSGLQFRSKVVDPNVDKVAGYQADCDADNKYTGIIYDEAGGAGGRGIMAKRGMKTHWTDAPKPEEAPLEKSDAELKELIHKTDWNDCVLVVKGNHITYSINGNVTADLIDDSPKEVKEGVLAFQIHGGLTMDVLFKDVKIKPLDSK